MNEAARYKQQFANLLEDEGFDRLALRLQQPNIFHILGITRTEIRHSNFLAWLLDANGNHGLGRLVVTRFLRQVLADERTLGISELDVESLNYSAMQVRREWQQIDILLEFPDLVVCIENKVDSQDHSNQLSRYRETIRKHFPEPERRAAFVYLTPAGAAPIDTAVHSDYVEYSYAHLVTILDRIQHIHGSRIPAQTQQYLTDYLTIIKREIVGNDELRVLAEKMYRTHREVLDFIFEHRPDRAKSFGELFSRVLTTKNVVLLSGGKGYVRFLTPALNPVIPRTGTFYSGREAFLFEIDFYWPKQDEQTKLTFRTVIESGDEKVRRLLSEQLDSVPGATKPKGQRFISHFLQKEAFDLQKLEEQGDDAICLRINELWERIHPLVSAVESQLLKREAELRQMKNRDGSSMPEADISAV